MKQDELEKLGVVGVNYGSQEPITLQLRLNYAFFAPKRGDRAGCSEGIVISL